MKYLFGFLFLFLCGHAQANSPIYASSFGAQGNGIVDDTAAIQAAVNYLGTTGGAVYFPGGHYCIKSGPIVVPNTEIGVTFDGQNDGGGSGSGGPVVLDACGADVSIFHISGQHTKLINLRVIGSQNPTTMNDAVHVDGGVYAEEFTTDDTAITGGRYALYLDAYEVYLQNSSFDHTYGPAMVYMVNTGGYIRKSKFDQAWPNFLSPAGVDTPTPWAPGTTYALGTVVTANGFRFMATIGGTSGTVVPTPAAYGVNITDGTVTWQIAGRTTYIGLQCDTNCGFDLSISDTDFSSINTLGIALTNSLAGAPPHYINIGPNNTFGGNVGHIGLGAGYGVKIRDNSFGACYVSGCTAISAYDSQGDLMISGNMITGGSNGIFIAASNQHTLLSGNMIGNAGTAISIAANTNYFTIVGNAVGGSALFGNNTVGISLGAGTSNHYTIQNNSAAGATTPLIDGGAGPDKSVGNVP